MTKTGSGFGGSLLELKLFKLKLWEVRKQGVNFIKVPSVRSCLQIKRVSMLLYGCCKPLIPHSARCKLPVPSLVRVNGIFYPNVGPFFPLRDPRLACKQNSVVRGVPSQVFLAPPVMVGPKDIYATP